MQVNVPFNPTFAKLSLLALYYRIFSIKSTFARWVWCLVIFQVCWFLAMVLCRIMFCLPIEKLWLETIPGRCLNVPLLLAVDWSVNAALAFALIALGMCMVRTLAISKSAKRRLGLLFVLGGL